ncbi:dimethylsulfonioproprionate lyase family protein [Dongia soli]|uniref:Dimethylsulfonioproprionate lyase family protein n=1 Tax=Dongia soli TaxID=600628 RepID=A0ABU5E6W5_9PROT|nr:dimethylsulfonioproprionate lyase family protein [Dongia soli]MDY0881298.1 dimethylsulfonioproprionate lyase family protein [Dongia soli]
MSRESENRSALQQLFVAIDQLLSSAPDVTVAFRALVPQATGGVGSDGTGTETLPVQQFWPACLAAAEKEGHPTVASAARALLDLTPSFRWQQNPNYRATPPSPQFLANYGYVEICGPSGFQATPDLRLGVLVLGPHNFYPPHRHPAEEIYLPLNAGFWQRGEDEVAAGSWQEREAGSVIHHPSWMPHATRAGANPLAAIYLWRGEVATAAKLD